MIAPGATTPSATVHLDRPARDVPASDRDTPGVIVPPPLIYIAALAAGFGLEALLK